MNLCLDGRLKARSLEMKRFVGRLQHESAEAFNDEVGSLYSTIPGVVVRLRVKRIGRLRIERAPGQSHGDIDVLAADAARRCLFAIETKDLEVARTPVELANELRQTFLVGLEPPSAVDRHLRRIDWLRKHVRETLEWLGIDAEDQERWKVEPLLVVDRELMGPFLTRPPITVVSFRELKVRLLKDSATLRG